MVRNYSRHNKYNGKVIIMTAEYKLSSKAFMGSVARTTDYKFTVDSLDDKSLAAVKLSIKEHNKHIRAIRRKYKKEDMGQILRVHIMPRGPRKDAAIKDYKYSRAYDSYLPIRYGTHFDVYVRQDTTAEYKMRRELDTGLTPGQQRKADNAEHRLLEAKWKERSALQEQNIHWNHFRDTYTTREVFNQDVDDRFPRR